MAQAFNIGNLVASIGANLTPLNLALKQANINMKASATKMASTMDVVNAKMMKVSKSMQTVGMGFSKGLTAPILGLGAASVKLAMDFEASMSKITGLVGVAKEQTDAWQESILKMAPALGKSPKELADAMFFVTSAGIKGAEAMEVLEMAAKGSVAGLGETEVIADLVTSAMNAYGKENLSAANATDILTAAVREGKAEAPALAGALGQVLPIASEMKVGFDEVGAAVAAMTRTGTDAATASTQLKSILSSLLKPTDQAEEALTAMGLSSAGLRKQIREDGLIATLQTLKTATAQYGETAMAEVFPNIRALSGVLDLMGSNAADNIAVFNSLSNATGSLDGAFKAASETTKFKFDQAVASVKTTLTNVGMTLQQDLIPIFQTFALKIQQLSDWWSSLSAEQKEAKIRFLAIAAAIGPAFLIISKLITVIAAVTKAIGLMNLMIAANPFVALGIAIAAVVAGVIIMWKKFAGFRAVVKFSAQKAWEYMQKAWIGMKMGAEIFFEGVKAYFSFIPKMAKIAGKAIAAIFDPDKSVGDVLKEEWEKYAESIADKATEIKEKYNAQFAAIESPDYKTILAAEEAAQAAKEAGEGIKEGLATGLGGTTASPIQTGTSSGGVASGGMAKQEPLPTMASKTATIELGIADQVGLEVEKLQANSNRLVAVATTMKNELGKVFTELGQMINDTLVQGITTFAESIGGLAAGTASMKDVFSNMIGVVMDFVGTLGKSLIASGIASMAFTKTLLTNPGLAIAAGAALVGLAAATKGILARGAGGEDGGGGNTGGTLSTVKVPAAANGALAYSPSMVQVGDNPRARFDPEVIKPASHLEELLNIPRNTESTQTMGNIPSEIMLRLSNGDLVAAIAFADKRKRNIGK